MLSIFFSGFVLVCHPSSYSHTSSLAIVLSSCIKPFSKVMIMENLLKNNNKKNIQFSLRNTEKKWTNKGYGFFCFVLFCFCNKYMDQHPPKRNRQNNNDICQVTVNGKQTNG